MRGKQKTYRTLNVTPEIFEQVDVWRREIERRWGRRVTADETIEYLLDATGPPEEEDEVPEVAQEKAT